MAIQRYVDIGLHVPFGVKDLIFCQEEYLATFTNDHLGAFFAQFAKYWMKTMNFRQGQLERF